MIKVQSHTAIERSSELKNSKIDLLMNLKGYLINRRNEFLTPLGDWALIKI